MHSFLEPETAQWIRLYVDGHEDLEAFSEWFVNATWDLSGFGSDSEQELAAEVQHRLAEYSSGDWTEDELKGLLSTAREAADRRAARFATSSRLIAGRQLTVGVPPSSWAGTPAATVLG